MKSFQKFARITALAFSVVFELMVGPFLGYFIGSYLMKNAGMGDLAVSIGVFTGFAVSLYAVMLTIMKINNISTTRSKGSQTRD